MNVLVIFIVAALAGMGISMARWFAQNPIITAYGDVVNQYLSDFRNIRYWIPGSGVIQRRYMRCVDGFEMSVQASNSHYCWPRNDCGPYRSVEVGYPNRPEALLEPYSDGYGEVFGWVPVEVIAKIIATHGGLASVPPQTLVDRSGQWKVDDAQAIRVPSQTKREQVAWLN